MTLIELIYHYQWYLKRKGRKEAERILLDITDKELVDHIVATFNDLGEFLKVDDDTGIPVPFDPCVEYKEVD